MSKKAKIIVIVVVLLLAIAIAVKFIFFRKEFLYAGTLEVTKVDVPARVNAVVLERIVDEGDHVKKDQTLLTFLCDDIAVQRDIINIDYNRADKLYKSGSSSKEVYDQMKSKKDDIDLKVSWCVVKSPVSGTVLNKYHEKGEMVNPGERLFTLGDVKEIYAWVYVPQPLVAQLKLGQELNGYIPELDMKQFPGRITVISSEAEFTPKNVQTREERTRLVYGIKVKFSNDKEILKPGMTIEVKID